MKRNSRTGWTFGALGLSILTAGACAIVNEPIISTATAGMAIDSYYEDASLVALVRAVESGNFERADALISDGADVNGVGHEGMTPLIWMLARQKVDGFRFLLSRGANPNQVTRWKDADGAQQVENPIHLAAMLEDASYLAAAVDSGGSVDLVIDDRSEESPIFVAILHDRVENVNLLVEKGADINHGDRFLTTPINYSVKLNRYTLSLHLLNLGADPTIKDRAGNSAVDSVKRWGTIGNIPRRSDRDSLPKFVEALKKRGVW